MLLVRANAFLSRHDRINYVTAGRRHSEQKFERSTRYGNVLWVGKREMVGAIGDPGDMVGYLQGLC